jgi:hypothetical protein
VTAPAAAGQPTEVAFATADPTVAPSQAPPGTPKPSPTPRPLPPGKVSDLCESFFGLSCGLGSGRYAPSRFDPAFDVKLGKGWSSAVHEGDLVTLERPQGAMTFASRIGQVFPGGVPTTPRDKARSIIEAFVVTEGVSSTRPASVKIGGRKGLSVDLAPIENRRVAIFTNGATAFYLEPGQTTRLVVIDVRGTAVVLAIEPSRDADLQAILATADKAAGTIRWR